MVNNYDEFIEYVNQLGVLSSLPNFIVNFPTIQDITANEWHTGNPDTDPWQWKNRAACEKKLAYGCLFGGTKGFIARHIYPTFYAACRPERSIEEAYNDGIISSIEMEVYKLFKSDSQLSTTDIRKVLGVTKKSGASKVDSAIIALQRDFYITVSGSAYKINKAGEPYGWASNTYCKAEDWHSDWLIGNEKIEKDTARTEIIELFASLMQNPNRKVIEQKLFKKCRK